jgi:HEAT repeat protein
MCRLIMAALVAVMLPVGAAALPPPMAAKAELLIKRLGSNDYYEREAATKALQQLGKSALPTLRVACDSKDAEDRVRTIG